MVNRWKRNLKTVSTSSAPFLIGLALKKPSEYLKVIQTLPTIHAMMNGKNVGFLSVRRHTSVSAEIHVMGVLPEEHTKGIGPGMMRLVSLLAEAIESWCPCFIFPSI
jgi:hypothetical protein